MRRNVEMGRYRTLLSLIVIGLSFIVAYQCAGNTQGDLEAIRELFLTFERGYEEHDLEKYMSVFSDEEFEYFSDMATPDDPTDDVHFLETESERRSAERVFENYGNLALKLTEPEIIIDGDSAEVKNGIEVAFLVSEKPDFPEIYYAASRNAYSLRKSNGEWKIVRWEQHETPSDELEAWKQERSTEELIQSLGSDDMVTWAVTISDLRKLREANTAPLIEALNHTDRNVRYRAIWVLSGTKDRSAAKALLDALKAEKNGAHVRAAAAKALIEAEDPVVDTELLAAFQTGPPELRRAACLALAVRLGRRMDTIREYAVRRAERGDEAIREEMARSLGYMMSTKGADTLEARLKDRNEVLDVRIAAAESLSGVGLESSVNVLRSVLKDRTEKTKLRVEAAQALFRIDKDRAFDLLAQVAGDETETAFLRQRVAFLLTLFRDTEE
jgi:HEAT repeat protein